MAFALNLEVRDALDTVSNAVVTSGVHPDLRVGFAPLIFYFAVNAFELHRNI